MESVRFNKCLSMEEKLYGMSYWGVVGGGIIGGAVWLKFSMTFGVLSMPFGYALCSYFAKKWHYGELQRFFYGKLPIVSSMLCSNKRLAKSYIKCFV